MKGTDQAGSLGPEGVYRMIRDIRLAEHWLGVEDLFIDKHVENAKLKLERSIATNKLLSKGHVITEDDIHLLSPGNGLKWRDKDQVIGKCLIQDLEANEIIYPNLLS